MRWREGQERGASEGCVQGEGSGDFLRFGGFFNLPYIHPPPVPASGFRRRFGEESEAP